ncbi:DegT/DnrJ/EryC1/StrS family aminotransferase [Pseudomonas piscis]|uniref:DegT/DnrJ/EryC1/StrS family aminotransferase n=1 Tax=Pseudomonas piscis TaxID=2614538 RepID=UPI0021D5C6F6|nr:DegT/DnrJ/EryC1/StrS family aminotransferase [Pseudomonas piscis]MCU7650108.1 aminotransferase class V-fold PLP-dependent enzyme [Pseudomonas piscis]
MPNNIPLYGVVSLPEMEEAALSVLRSGRISGGEWVSRFELEFGKLTGHQHVVSTIDMTSALFLALHLAGVKEGDEVLTTAFACLSTNSAIAQIKAKPVWVDVCHQSVDMDLKDFERKITSKTKAVILYHVAGYPGPAKELARLCKNYNIYLIEDCNNAMFASRDSAVVGTVGDFAVYSFYPNRQINATEGGALVCRKESLAITARKLRKFGINYSDFRLPNGEINKGSDIPEIGWSMTLNNLCAAIGFSQISSLKVRHKKTLVHVEKLKFLLSDIEGLKFVPAEGDGVADFWVLLVFVEHRDAVLSNIKKYGVMASSIHQRNDLYSGFSTQEAQLKNTEYLQNHILGIPCGWWLEDDDLESISNALRKAISAVGI